MRGRMIAAGALALALAGGVALSDEKKQVGPTPEDMAEGMRLAEPGEHHKPLAAMAGEWDVVVKSWMDPDPAKPPVESKATATGRVILGGRFVTEEFRGEMMGTTFEAFAVAGFDNLTGKHTAVLMDTMGTFHVAMSGACEGPACKTVTLVGHWKDHKGREWGWRSVRTQIDADHATAVGYAILPPDMVPPGAPRESRCNEVHYTRRK